MVPVGQKKLEMWSIFRVNRVSTFVDCDVFNKDVCCLVYLLGTVRPLYRTGVSLLSRERFLYI